MSPFAWRAAPTCRIIPRVRTAQFLCITLLFSTFAACNRNQPPVLCAPLSAVTLVRVSQAESGQPRRSVIDNRYQVQALMDFANGRRQGFSARRKGLPQAATSATFYNGSQPLLTFGVGENFFSLSCAGYAGVQEANRVQIAEFERLLSQQP